MARGFKTGGRQKGSKNKKTLLLEQEGRAIIEEALGKSAFDGDAHSLLILIYKNEALPLQIRLDAAKVAIRFEKAALAAVELGGALDHTHYGISDQPVAEEEWAEQHVTEH